MFYFPLQVLMVIIYRIYFRSMHMANLKYWHTKKPTLLVCNHVNAFLDPIMLPAQMRLKVYFITRGDVFKTPFLSWAMWQLNQLPMFRRRDGLKNLKRNEETFNRCFDLLKEGKRIMIFPEGDCVNEMHLRPIQKGSARMVFGAIEKYGWDLDLHIQTTSVHYSNPSEFRSDVTTNVGKPFPVIEYKELYESEPAKAITKMTKDIEKNMKEHYIQMDDKSDIELFDQWATIARSETPSSVVPWRQLNNKRFDREKAISDKLNDIRANDPDSLEPLKTQASKYFDRLKGLNLRDRDLSRSRKSLAPGTLFLILGLPLFIVGYLLNIVQFTVADNKAKKAKEVIFKNSTRLVFTMLMNLGVVFILFLGLLIAGNIWMAIGGVVAFWLLAWYTINYREYLRDTNYAFRYHSVKGKKSKEMEELTQERQAILDLIPGL
ncbi:1-acyl-sn-glycerol-3-phosphate acyltransferase [bacterium SCSIO 12741]|nr:1-acyl-sn-glycerol-3-phosphate acyltransferase [bacterium SCSIO 12741]